MNSEQKCDNCEKIMAPGDGRLLLAPTPPGCTHVICSECREACLVEPVICPVCYPQAYPPSRD